MPRRLDKAQTSLGDYLDARGYGEAFQEDHLLPQAGAIWSASIDTIRDLPAASFIRFCQNHGLLKIVGRPIWRTVDGGSRVYVKAITAAYRDQIRLNSAVRHVRRQPDGVRISDVEGRTQTFDHVVIAAHADQALRLLDDPSSEESRLLGAFRYTRNHAVLHGDVGLMPRRRGIWSSWELPGQGRRGGRVHACSASPIG